MHLHENENELLADRGLRAPDKVSEPRGRAKERAVDPRSPASAMGVSGVLALQRSVGNATTAGYLQREKDDGDKTSPVHSAIKGGGSPIDHATRAPIEKHLGADFSDVRLHVDAQSAESVKAAAYTVGNDIVMHPNHFQPGSVSTQRTLAHELTHVKQQRSGPVEGSEAPGGIKLSTPSDRFERQAEASADDFLNGGHSHEESAAAPSGAVQREEEGEPSLQRLTVQREEDEEEGEEG